ncbi:hypothetical protein [Leyella stercorea]|uniref:hypothetical protein n=1 Tax=Leyella stercorea TaxID=363265 RepID=UPI00241E41D2|nr:hypothetical protein [Leyella stercorea]
MPSASVGADIRIGRRRHPRRSAQTSASVDADIRVGRYETEKMKICRAEDVLKDAKSGVLV